MRSPLMRNAKSLLVTENWELNTAMHAPTNQPGPEHRKRGTDLVASIPAKEDWIQLYTSRILRVWFHQGGPLGLAYAYANWIRNDLAKAYDHPLTRAFIEQTY